jgi:hypothetical protein
VLYTGLFGSSSLVQKKKRIYGSVDEDYQSAKRRVFTSAVSVMMNDKVTDDSNLHVLASLFKAFPDRGKMTDGRSWLPLHMAIALGEKVREEDVYILHANDPLAMQRYSWPKVEEMHGIGYLPCHFLCMQIQPNMSIVRDLSMRDMKAFTMNICCTRSYMDGFNALRLAAQYSESVELLKNLLQIDQSMTKGFFDDFYETRSFTSLGFLCERSLFDSFNEMLKCLLSANSSIEVMGDSLVSYFRSLSDKSDCPDIKKVLTLMKSLLEANSTIADYTDINGNCILHWASQHLKGELSIAVLSLLFERFSDKVGGWLMLQNRMGYSPIHLAAECSTLNFVEFFIK